MTDPAAAAAAAAARQVHNINIEPLQTSHVFLVHGMDAKGAGRVFTLDGMMVANGAMPSCSTEDYKYVPQPSCIMGRRLSMQRKRPASLCFGEVGKAKEPMGCKPDVDGIVDAECRCACERSRDLQCDFGFVPEATNGDFACVEMATAALRSPAAAAEPGTCPLIRDRKYVVSRSGYRLSPHDYCVDPTSAGIFDTDGRGRPLHDGGGAGGGAGPHRGGGVVAGIARALVAILAVALVGLLLLAAAVRLRASGVGFGGAGGGAVQGATMTVADSISAGIDWVKERLGMGSSLRKRRMQENFELLAGDEFGLDIGDEERSASPLS